MRDVNVMTIHAAKENVVLLSFIKSILGKVAAPPQVLVTGRQ